MKKRIWITWENQIRNKSMSARLGAELYPIVNTSSFFKRYCVCAYHTIRLLSKNYGNDIFVQNPSVVLSFLAVILRPFFRYKLIVDAHNAGVFPGKKLQFLADYINKKADHVIVTNEGLADYIRKIGGSSVVLPDPLPLLEVIEDEASQWKNLNSPSVLMVCSWAEDEPYCEVISAAIALPEVTFYVTGNSKERERDCDCPIPANVVLTGFVSENDYHLLLIGADIIMDLTTREDCLVCGAYEAISIGKPIILSNTNALRNYFGDAAIYVDNNSVSISNGIKSTFSSYSKISEQAKLNSQEIEGQWLQLFNEVQRLL